MDKDNGESLDRCQGVQQLPAGCQPQEIPASTSLRNTKNDSRGLTSVRPLIRRGKAGKCYNQIIGFLSSWKDTGWPGPAL